MPRPANAPFRVFKVRWELRGGHVHLSLFVANHPSQTYANCGQLCMSEGDFAAFRREMPNATFEERVPT